MNGDWLAKIQEVLRCVRELIAQNGGVVWTVRQMYYRLVSPPYQIFPNTRSSYTGFDKQLVQLRESGEVEDYRFVDNARSISGGDYSDWDVLEYFNNVLESVKSEANNFTKSWWDDQEYNVVVVLEKDALSRLVGDVTREFRVALAVGRGYSSRTQILQIADDHIVSGKKNVILYLGDFDPSGLDIERSLSERVDAEVSVDGLDLERLALTYDQAKGLPPNPTKFSDTRSPAYVREYGRECWELDALPPKDLQQLVRRGIWKYIDDDLWQEVQKAERDGQDRLEGMFADVDAYLKKKYGGESE